MPNTWQYKGSSNLAKQSNSILIFYALNNYLLVSTNPTRNKFNTRLNALHFLAVLTDAVFRYGDFEDEDTISTCTDQISSIFENLSWLRMNYDPRWEQGTIPTIDWIRIGTEKLDAAFQMTFDIIIHLSLISPKSVELMWNAEEQGTPTDVL